MKTRRSALCLAIAALALTVLPGAALANAPNNESATYDWILLGPPDFPANVAMAPNGDTATLTGSGTFGVHPKSATGGGTLTHGFATGGSVTVPYTVTDLISFQPYGCGVGPVPLPANACEAKLEFRISIAGGAGEGILTIYCLISDDGHVPQGVAEGARLNIPGSSTSTTSSPGRTSTSSSRSSRALAANKGGARGSSLARAFALQLQVSTSESSDISLP